MHEAFHGGSITEKNGISPTLEIVEITSPRD